MANLKLDIHWAFGFSKEKIGATQSLCTKDRNALFLLCAHSGVIYDFENRKQTVLQGHCNIITSCAIDKTKRWIVTADSGPESIMVVWDSLTQMPVKTYLAPHMDGVAAVEFSDDGAFIATLSSKGNGYDDQELAVWAWTTPDENATQRAVISGSPGETFHSVKFNPNDPYSLVTTSPNAVYFWSWESFVLDSYNGKVAKADLGHVSGEHVCTIFLPNTETALTATSHGYVIVWENKTDALRGAAASRRAAIKSAVKAVRLLECGINVISTSPNNYLVLGCSDGAVRFYDFYLRLEAWFEDLNAGPVMSVSFAIQPCPYAYNEGGQPGLKFWVPDFVVGTKDSFVVGVESRLFDEVRKEDRRGTLLMQGLSGAVTALACHPNQSLVAFLCRNGVLQLWNYELKLLINIREFANLRSAAEAEKPSSSAGARSTVTARDIAFHCDGQCLAVSFSNGMVKILATGTLADLQTFSPSLEPIGRLKFSPSGQFLAAADDSFHVMLFRRDISAESPRSPAGAVEHRPFVYLGRALAHNAKIIGLDFGFKDTNETLLSVSEDRFCVEYDLVNTSMENGVLTVSTVATDGTVRSALRIESFARPCCTLWHPRNEEDNEDRFIVANTEFKFKEFNVDSKQCRKTCLAPRYGFPPSSLSIIPYIDPFPAENQPPIRAYAFATSSKVIGVGRLPLDGDPSKANAIVAHPDEVTSVAVSCDGNFVFSAGGADLSVNMWAVLKDPTPPAADQGIEPFLALLEGGAGGELHDNLMDYFYYSQLRHGGEDTMDVRHLTGNVPLEEIPALVRSVGYYPSEEEVINMINEVRYKQFVVTGEMQDFIGAEDFIKLYVNHRPVVPLEKHLIQAAMDTISDRYSSIHVLPLRH